MHFLNKKGVIDLVRERHELFDEAGLTNPFACSAWMLNLIDQVARDDWTFVVPEQVADGVSLMLLYSEPGAPRRCAAVTNYYASLYSPLISSASHRVAAADALVDQLAMQRPHMATVRLAPLDAESEDTAALAHAFTRRGWYVKQYFCFGNWYLRCAGLSFENYMKERDSQLQNTWKRKSRKFASVEGTPEGARLEIVTDSDGVQAAMDAYDAIYARSWKKAEPYPDFVRRWAVICSQNGWLRLGLAWVGAVPVAAQFWFTMNQRAYIYKLAYDEEYSKWSAGTVLSAHMFRHSLEHDKVVEIDYLTGDDPYKKSWMTERRERIGLIASNLRSPTGLIVAAREWASDMKRRLQPAGRGVSGPLNGRSSPTRPT